LLLITGMKLNPAQYEAVAAVEGVTLLLPVQDRENKNSYLQSIRLVEMGYDPNQSAPYIHTQGI